MNHLEKRDSDGLENALKSVLMLLPAHERKNALDGLESGVATYGPKVREIAINLLEAEELAESGVQTWPPPKVLWTWMCERSRYSPEMPVIYGLSPERAFRYFCRRVVHAGGKLIKLTLNSGEMLEDKRYMLAVQYDMRAMPSKGVSDPSGVSIIFECDGPEGGSPAYIKRGQQILQEYGESVIYEAEFVNLEDVTAS